MKTQEIVQKLRTPEDVWNYHTSTISFANIGNAAGVEARLEITETAIGEYGLKVNFAKLRDEAYSLLAKAYLGSTKRTAKSFNIRDIGPVWGNITALMTSEPEFKEHPLRVRARFAKSLANTVVPDSLRLNAELSQAMKYAEALGTVARYESRKRNVLNTVFKNARRSFARISEIRDKQLREPLETKLLQEVQRLARKNPDVARRHNFELLELSTAA